MDEELVEALKKTRQRIGELYPMLKAADGELLDGFHRVEADRKWGSRTLRNIRTKLDKLVVRHIAHRRRGIPASETRKTIDGIAQELIALGIAKPDPDPHVPKHLRDRPVVIPLVAELLGEKEYYVARHISDRYKRGSPHQFGEQAKKRSRIEIRADMLRHLVRNKQGLKQTQLMSKANLSWEPLQEHLEFLHRRGLIEFKGGAPWVVVTPLGRKVLSAYVYAAYWLSDRIKREVPLKRLEKILVEVFPEDE